MQHPNKFRNISTTKEKGSSTTFVFDTDTDEIIFMVQKDELGGMFEISNGRYSTFDCAFQNSNSFEHKEKIIELCGEFKQEGAWGKSLNPNFNKHEYLSSKGCVIVAKHFAQFETSTWKSN